MAQPKTNQPSISVSVKADAATPIGEQLLSNEGLITPSQSTAAGGAQVQDAEDAADAGADENVEGGQNAVPVVQTNGVAQTQ